MRFDVLLADLHLFKSRSQARGAIESGAVLLNGVQVKPSHIARPGDRVMLGGATGPRELEILELPHRSVSKKAARELVREV